MSAIDVVDGASPELERGRPASLQWPPKERPSESGERVADHLAIATGEKIFSANRCAIWSEQVCKILQ
jgi:hypothetical protein